MSTVTALEYWSKATQQVATLSSTESIQRFYRDKYKPRRLSTTAVLILARDIE